MWSVCWSPANEHHIFTGDASGEVRLWDVRRSGCQAALDMNTTQRPRTPAVQEIEQCTRRAGSQEFSGRQDHGASGADRRGSKRQKPSSSHSDHNSSSGRTLHSSSLAHEGPVTSILATLDGLNVVTSGSDNRVRLWDSEYLHNQLVHYAATYNRGSYPKRLSSTPDGRFFFYPRGDDVQVGCTGSRPCTVVSI